MHVVNTVHCMPSAYLVCRLLGNQLACWLSCFLVLILLYYGGGGKCTGQWVGWCSSWAELFQAILATEAFISWYIDWTKHPNKNSMIFHLTGRDIILLSMENTSATRNEESYQSIFQTYDGDSGTLIQILACSIYTWTMWIYSKKSYYLHWGRLARNKPLLTSNCHC